MTGGHGQLFVQRFARSPLVADGPLLNMSPADAAAQGQLTLVVGSGALTLAAASNSREAHDLLPAAATAMTLPVTFRTLDARPIYVRAPDAMPRAA